MTTWLALNFRSLSEHLTSENSQKSHGAKSEQCREWGIVAMPLYFKNSTTKWMTACMTNICVKLAPLPQLYPINFKPASSIFWNSFKLFGVFRICNFILPNHHLKSQMCYIPTAMFDLMASSWTIFTRFAPSCWARLPRSPLRL